MPSSLEPTRLNTTPILKTAQAGIDAANKALVKHTNLIEKSSSSGERAALVGFNVDLMGGILNPNSSPAARSAGWTTLREAFTDESLLSLIDADTHIDDSCGPGAGASVTVVTQDQQSERYFGLHFANSSLVRHTGGLKEFNATVGQTVLDETQQEYGLFPEEIRSVEFGQWKPWLGAMESKSLDHLSSRTNQFVRFETQLTMQVNMNTQKDFQNLVNSRLTAVHSIHDMFMNTNDTHAYLQSANTIKRMEKPEIITADQWQQIQQYFSACANTPVCPNSHHLNAQGIKEEIQRFAVLEAKPGSHRHQAQEALHILNSVQDVQNLRLALNDFSNRFPLLSMAIRCSILHPLLSALESDNDSLLGAIVDTNTNQQLAELVKAGYTLRESIREYTEIKRVIPEASVDRIQEYQDNDSLKARAYFKDGTFLPIRDFSIAMKAFDSQPNRALSYEMLDTLPATDSTKAA